MRRTGAKRASRNGAGCTRMRFLEIFGALSHTIPGNPGVRERRKRQATRSPRGRRKAWPLEPVGGVTLLPVGNTAHGVRDHLPECLTAAT